MSKPTKSIKPTPDQRAAELAAQAEFEKTCGIKRFPSSKEMAAGDFFRPQYDKKRRIGTRSGENIPFILIKREF